MTTRWRSVGMAAALLAAGLTTITATASAATTDAPTTAAAKVDTSSAIVQLIGDPVSTALKTKPAQGKKIDWAGTNVRSYRAELSAQRNDFKQWLRTAAPKAKVTGEYDISLNAVAVQLNGTSLATLRSSALVTRAEYEGVYEPTAADPDLSIIHAEQAWARAGGSANAGTGVKVGVIDSGIDTTHSCFSDAGYPAQKQLGDTRFTNNKVIVARVFNNKTPSRGYTAQGIGEHGTHVAGTIACNYQTAASVNGVTIPAGVSGVAPRALLGNYNVFPADVANARSEDILNALDAAVADGMDVLNMSLGGGARGMQDLLTIAVDNIDRGANVVVAVAAGNSGPGYGTVESPGSAARALTAGASTVPHFIGATLKVGAASYSIAAGELPTLTVDLTAPLGVVTGAIGGLGNACTALPAGSLTGKIAVVSRGSCTFTTKARSAQTAGAIATIVVNNVAGDPTAMATDGTTPPPTIAAYMASLADRPALAGANGVSATIVAQQSYQVTTNVDIMAGFSSQGPTDVDRRVKPDVVAPGVNVLSSIPKALCGGAECFAFFNGTSMATPHLAGSAAVVKQQHTTWSAAQIRSAIVNTADTGVLRRFSDAAPTSDPQIVGAGRENLLSAVNATVLLDPVSVSFGTIPSGSGQSRNASIAVTNTTAAALSVSVDGSAKFSATIGAGATTTITVTAAAAKGDAPGHYSATLKISSGGQEVAHAVLFYVIG